MPRPARACRATPARRRIDVIVADPAWLEVLPEAPAQCRRAARAALRHAEGVPEGDVELALALESDRAVRVLNRTYRGKDKPTNVLSFPSGTAGHLGDVALALGTLRREARAQRKPLADHLAHLVVHGVLHLLGYDHELGEAEARRMESLETAILARLGIADPYRPRPSAGRAESI